MAKFFDKMLLFLYSCIVFLFATWMLITSSSWIPISFTKQLVDNMYFRKGPGYSTIAISLLCMLLSVRFIWVIIRSRHARRPTINQSNELGQIQVTIETIEQIALKSAYQIAGISDAKAKVQVTDVGLSIIVRANVDGELTIPELAQQIQSNVKTHIQQIAGIPVAQVNIYISDLNQRPSSIQNRVE